VPTELEHDWFPRQIPENVVIGERSWLYSSFAFVHSRSRRPVAVRIGSDTGVYNPSFFELGEEGEVEIGDFCALVAVTIVTNSRVVIGDYAFLAHDVVVADSFAAVPPSRFDPGLIVTPVRGAGVGDGPSSITIGNNSWIGARAVILSGAEIGKGAIVGAACVVDFKVPPYAIVAGNPGKVVGWSR
jgi:acetyltransferase-like isoleucine patch superfamily enzyme